MIAAALRWLAGAFVALWLGMAWFAAELLADDVEDWE